MSEVKHEENGRRGAFYIEQDGRRVAEMRYHRTGDGVVDIHHTEVDDELTGQGVGRELLDAAVRWARESQTKFTTSCRFARAQFARDDSIRDVLV